MRAILDIEALIGDCIAAVDEPNTASVVKEVLEAAVRRPDHVAAALPIERAEIIPLYASPVLSVTKVVWAPGMRFPPHDHLMWAAIALFAGQEDNEFFRRTNDGLQHSGGKVLTTGDVALLGKDVIHAVTNPRRTFTAAIHVYGGDITSKTGRTEWEGPDLTETPYDFARTRRVFELANGEGA
jgi:predicted metal-dependent enzyme (double-stranded beta helix superfamily)